MLEVSALLTTYNRAHLLPKVLEGLERQSLEPTRFEVIAIDDGSVDDTLVILAAWQSRLPLRIIRQNHAGLAAAKNLGVSAATGSILVFLDDDDVADPDLLGSHLAANLAYSDPAVAVLGYTDLAPDIATIPIMHHVTAIGCQLFSYHSMKPYQMMGHTAFWGGRSSCKRSLLMSRGVFHPDFRFGCEDIELGWRLGQQGFKVVYEPRARSTMIRAITFDQFCRRSYWQGRSQYRFAELHDDPAVRTYCEIDMSNIAWRRRFLDYAAHLRWTRKLDTLATAWSRAELALPSDTQKALDGAYREAFFLSRAKGISDAEVLSGH